MSVRSFLDTNVLVYSDDQDEPHKQAKSIELYERARLERTGTVSTQVLQEYFAATTRKLGVPAETARRKVELYGRLDVVVIELQDVLAAIDLHRLHSVSIWDALIVRAAQRARCRVLYSEDFQPGRRFDDLQIVNPFA
jgi:predicted nucleic acid-binding protein